MIDLRLLAREGVFNQIEVRDNGNDSNDTTNVFEQQVLNDLAARGRSFCAAVRRQIISLLSDPNSTLFADDGISSKVFCPADEARMHLPMRIGGFTDFLCSEVHATNVGSLDLTMLLLY